MSRHRAHGHHSSKHDCSNHAPDSTERSGDLPVAPRSGRAGRTRTLERLQAQRVVARRVAGGFAAMAVVGALVSMAAPGQAGTPVAAEKAAKKPVFSGYSITTVATPMRIEIYDPSIPIPASPQAELNVGYAAVASDTAVSRARASYLWPGAAVGEGFKTIVAELGLPPEVGEQGYPVQVNAIYPSGPEEQAAQPAPGMIQHAKATKEASFAENSSSTDGQAAADDDATGEEPGDEETSEPVLPGLPAVPGVKTLVVGGGSDADAAAPQGEPLLPEPLAALVDMGSFTAVARTENDSDVYGQSRAIASDITIFGGLATLDGVKTVANASSDGKAGKGRGVAEFGDLHVMGQTFTFGPDGFEATGAGNLPLPPIDPVLTAFKQLGITITVPKPEYEKDGDAFATTMPGLIIDIDLTKLRKPGGALTDVANTIIDQIPDETGELKSVIRAAANLGTRVVFYLGNTFAGVDTVPPPDTTTEEPTEEPTSTPTEKSGPAPGPSGGGGAPAGGTEPPPAGSTEASAAPEAIQPVASPTEPGLPALFSFPGFLLYGGLIGAGAAGFLTRRLGLAALGGFGSCPHGLDSGLPDLRKVT